MAFEGENDLTNSIGSPVTREPDAASSKATGLFGCALESTTHLETHLNSALRIVSGSFCSEVSSSAGKLLILKEA